MVGLAIVAAGALPHVATLPISDLYHAPGATPEDQAALAFVWHATEGVFAALLGAGMLIVPGGLLLLGAAMLGDPAFGRGYGWFSLTIGALVLVTALVFLIIPPSPIVGIGVLALLVFHLVVGWKVFTLARTP